VGVLTVLVVSVGGIMGMTFKSKNTSEGNELLSSKAVYILGELKKNILNAKADLIQCPEADDNGTQISFRTKDGNTTTLSCNVSSSKIASSSANGEFNFLGAGVRVTDCNQFVECVTLDDRVTSVKFTLNLRAPDNAAGAGSTGVFYGVATPRE